MLGEYKIGDCLELMKELPDNSIDSIVTDPPYGINFMAKKWDYDVPTVEVWKECLRVLKPGGHIVVACGTRTQHRMAVNIEDAGFEIRDIITWLYGSGFPKSLNIGKAVDKLEGNDRELVGVSKSEKDFRDLGKNTKEIHGMDKLGVGVSCKRKEINITKGTTDWEGWGTALKPAQELWTLARKPLSEKTVALNVLKWGTGGINIDDCRVPLGDEKQPSGSAKRVFAKNQFNEEKNYGDNKQTPADGRFPANVIHDGSEEVVNLFPSTKSGTGAIKKQSSKTLDGNSGSAYGSESRPEGEEMISYGDSGSAARFFYCAKASKAERNEGLQQLEHKQMDTSRKEGNPGGNNPRNRGVHKSQNFHPTVKPVKLMRYLIRLITPKGGILLDPYFGSGTTGVACIEEGIRFLGFELSEEYEPIIKGRLNKCQKRLGDF